MIDLQEVSVYILAGGKGTRLSSVVRDVPKPMAPIGDKPFLEYLINFYSEQGFKKFILLTGYKSEVIEKYFNDGSNFGVSINYSKEESPLGTGGAFKEALKKYKSQYCLLVNGDTFFDYDVKRFLQESKLPYSILLKRMENLSRYGSIKINEESIIEQFIEKDEKNNKPGLINAGAYFFKTDIIEKLQDGFLSLETETFPELVKMRQLQGVTLDGNFIDIGIPDDYNFANKELLKWTKKSQSIL